MKDVVKEALEERETEKREQDEKTLAAFSESQKGLVEHELVLDDSAILVIASGGALRRSEIERLLDKYPGKTLVEVPTYALWSRGKPTFVPDGGA